MVEKIITLPDESDLQESIPDEADSKEVAGDRRKTGKSKRSKPKKQTKLEKLERENQRLKEEVSDLKNRYMRLNAELYNLRKRYDREMEQVLIYSNGRLMEKILPLVDDLERSLRSSDENSNFVAFRNGIELIYKNLMKVLQDEGVQPIKAVGQPFDYNVHEAVLMVEKEDVESGRVIEEVQRGYLYKDRVLRHAKVIVAK